MQYLGARPLRLVKWFIIIVLSIQTMGCAIFPANIPIPSPSPQSLLFEQNPSGSFDVNNILHIDVIHSFFCGYPVLVTDQSTYDSKTIQQMADYMTAYSAADGDVPSQTLPGSLKFAQGIFAGSIANWNLHGVDCQSLIVITNIGQDPVQITQIGMKLATSVAPNTYHYRLIDACSLPLGELLSHCPLSIQRVVGGVPTYTGTFHFASTEANSVIQSQVDKQLIVSPGKTISARLIISATDSPRNGLYVVVPELTVTTQKQVGLVLDLSQLTSTIAFIEPGTQLSCYQLHGNTVAPLMEGTIEPPSVTLRVSGMVTCV